MQIDKSEIINFLKDHGQHDQAATADKQLPETVDTDEHGVCWPSTGSRCKSC